MAIRMISRQWLRYNDAIFDTLKDKCQRETKFGKIANALLLALFNLVKILKTARVKYQRYLRDPSRRLFALIKSPAATTQDFPTWPWDKPIPQNLTSLNQSRRVVIIAELSIPQCKRYRVDQKAAALSALGYEPIVISFTDSEAVFRALAFARIAIFYRTPYWPAVRAMIAECQRTGVSTVYDIDDLVFDVDEYRLHPVLSQLPQQEVRNLLAGAESYRDCLAACDFAIASTGDLAVWMRKYCKGQVFVLENALDALSMNLIDYAASRRRKESDQILIGYGSGTKSHDADFALVSSALCRLMQQHKNVRLVIHGYLTLPPELEAFQSRIQRVGLLPAQEYLQSVADFDINLAPLVTSTFNDAKSNIKFLEAAVLGVPTVASPSAAFRGVITDGENGFLAATPEQWFEKLDALVNDAQLRFTMGQRAKAAALTTYSPEKTGEYLSQFVDQILSTRAINTGGRQRVLLVNCHYAPFSFGGATLVVEHMARAIAKTDANVAVFTLNHLGYPEWRTLKYEDQGVLVYSVVKRPKPKEAEVGTPEVAELFSAMLREYRPSVVHFHAIQGMGHGLVGVAKNSGGKVVVTSHDDWWYCKRQFRMTESGAFCGYDQVDLRACGNCTGDLGGTLVRFREMQDSLSQADLILTPSKHQQRLMQLNFPSGPTTEVNKNGIPNPTNSALTDGQNRSGPLRFAFIGGIGATHKGYDFVKSAFESLQNSNYELRLVDLNQKLGHGKRKLNDWKVRGTVQLVPPFSASTMDDFYRDIDVLLAPSQCPESFGLAIREAAARGVFVIATNCGGVPEDLAGLENCILLELGDQEGLRKALYQLISNPSSARSRKSALFTDIEHQAKNLLSWYDVVLQAASTQQQ